MGHSTASTFGSRRDIGEVDVVVLAGGLGTRVASHLGGVPKLLAPAGGKPFLDHLLRWLAQQGARRVILSLGHQAGRVADYLAAGPRHGLELAPIVEPEPMGTAGAIAFCRSALRSDPVMVVNGDTLVDVDLEGFLRAFERAGTPAGLVCVAVEDGTRYGQVEINRAGRVARFREKRESAGPGWINAGIYLFDGSVLDRISAVGRGSLERDVLQRLPSTSLAAFRAGGRFIDIGTPETLAAADAFVADFASASGRR
ncbi:MAG TPA: nucleotidyltransferase family protein [Stellaceae bacterium]|nr:nucleotidyltransferase family protein [Stellaceae bacterium]